MSETADYDGAWKETLERYLQPFLELCFPKIAATIDWTTPFEFLDKELQEVVRGADLGKQRADKLIDLSSRSASCWSWGETGRHWSGARIPSPHSSQRI